MPNPSISTVAGANSALLGTIKIGSQSAEMFPLKDPQNLSTYLRYCSIIDVSRNNAVAHFEIRDNIGLGYTAGDRLCV